MSIQLNLLKRRVAFEKNKNNLAEIYSMYWEKISTSITRQTGIVEIKLYKYSTKEIIKKFGINNNMELVYLTSLSADYLGVCKFCGEEKYRYMTRTGNDKQTTCRHTKNCAQCKKPCGANEGEENLCGRCYYKDEPQDPYDDPSSTENMELNALFRYDPRTILHYFCEEDIQKMKLFLTKRLTIFRKLLKILKD